MGMEKPTLPELYPLNPPMSHRPPGFPELQERDLAPWRTAIVISVVMMMNMVIRGLSVIRILKRNGKRKYDTSTELSKRDQSPLHQK